ncbi:MAG: SGNH/GDSL hydrolase family protein [Myxococcaceae bacterium]
MRKLLSLLMAVVVVGCGGSGGETGPDGEAGGPDGGAVGPDGEVTGGWTPGTDAKGLVHFVGRFDLSDPVGPKFSWPGSTIKTRFRGTTLTVTLDEDTDTNRYDVFIDGKPTRVLSPTVGVGNYIVAVGLPDGLHDLELVKRTESYLGITQLTGISGSPLVQTPAPDRYIELIGDSVTTGHGVLGTSATCPFSSDTQAETQAWGALAAAELGVARATLAYSGKGVFRNFAPEDEEPFPVFYERTLADIPDIQWNFAAYSPAVIVVNLGTNDFIAGDPGQDFVDAYIAFVEQIRGHHKNAWVIASTPTLIHDADPAGEEQRTKVTEYLQEVVAHFQDAGDSKVQFLDLVETDPSDGYGCNYHPTIVTQQKLADQVVAKVRELTGW